MVSALTASIRGLFKFQAPKRKDLDSFASLRGSMPFSCPAGKQ
jgi:hypothetical protein